MSSIKEFKLKIKLIFLMIIKNGTQNRNLPLAGENIGNAMFGHWCCVGLNPQPTHALLVSIPRGLSCIQAQGGIEAGLFHCVIDGIEICLRLTVCVSQGSEGQRNSTVSRGSQHRAGAGEALLPSSFTFCTVLTGGQSC